METLAPSPSVERDVWRNVGGEWRQLYGDFRGRGVSIEHHRFQVATELDWARSFHADSLEICFNLQGGAELHPGGDLAPAALRTRSMAGYTTGRGPGLHARRFAHDQHHFVTLELSRTFLAAQLGKAAPVAGLRAPVRRYLEGGDDSPAVAFVEPMPIAVQNAARALIDPPVSHTIQPLWYEAKALELMCLLLFSVEAGNRGENTPGPDGRTGEFFCAQQKRLAGERVAQAKAFLERDLENPPTLEMLAAEVGWGPFHLSRAFSEHTGLTIPQYLRGVRLERAARLLREGRGNVTEVAMAVGYRSLSHFSKAFWERFGCCPGLYADPKLAALAPGRTRVRR